MIRLGLGGFILLNVACSAGRSGESVPPALAQGVGCYEISNRLLPQDMAEMLPDSVSLLPIGGPDRFAVRTTPSYRQRFRGLVLTWKTRGDSLWLYQTDGLLWDEYRLARSGPDWKGVIIGGTDVILPDSLYKGRPVFLRRIACLGFT
jgi:hypothetical protein